MNFNHFNDEEEDLAPQGDSLEKVEKELDKV